MAQVTLYKDGVATSADESQIEVLQADGWSRDPSAKPAGPDGDEALRGLLLTLDAEDRSLWNGDGSLSMERARQVLGVGSDVVSRASVDAAWPQLNAETLAAEQARVGQANQ